MDPSVSTLHISYIALGYKLHQCLRLTINDYFVVFKQLTHTNTTAKWQPVNNSLVQLTEYPA